MGLNYKIALALVSVLVAGHAAEAQHRGGRGGGGGGDRWERHGGGGGRGGGHGGERREHRQERREDRIQQRQSRINDRQDRINDRQERLERRENRVDRLQERQRREERNESWRERNDPRDQARDQQRRDRLERREDRIENRQDRVERREDRVERREDRLERREDRIEHRREHRDDWNRGDHNRNNGGGGFGRHEDRRQHVRQDRFSRRYDIERNRHRLGQDRQSWRQHRRLSRYIDRSSSRRADRWHSRYSSWSTYCPRPAPIYVRTVIRWVTPMPDVNTLQYTQVESVATNLEALTREIFDIMADAVQSNKNEEYKARLTRVLAELADSADNFTDAVYEGEYFEDSLYELFQLESATNLATQTLDGYSKEVLVEDQMNSLRYYVAELLYIYHQNR